MSYPPAGGGYPPYQQQPQRPPGQELGFQGPGQGSSYPLYPTGGGNAPYPPQNTGYPGGSSPYPTQGQQAPSAYPSSSPYPPAPGGSPYPPAPGGSPYPPAPGGSPYPPAPGGSPYPPAPGASPYPPGPGGSPYPPAPGGSPYPAAPGGSPYPAAPGGSPYPPAPGGSPYPAAPGASPYPAAPAASPYPPAPGGSPYPPAPGGSPYPPAPGSSPYPPASGTSPYPPSSGTSPYPPTSGTSPYPPAPGQGSSPYPAAPGQGSSPYPSLPGSSPYPPAAGQGTSPYPSGPGQGSSPYPPAPSQGSPYPPGPPGQNPYSSSPTHRVSSQQDSRQSSGNPYSSSPGHQQGYPGGAAPYVAGGVLTAYVARPTVRAFPAFDASSDAASLRKAMKGFGTDEKAIIGVLGRRTSDQRQHILLKYQQSYGRDLIKDLQSELGGRFEQVILSMMTPMTIFLAQELNKAMKGIGTKERVLIEILCTRDNNTIRAVKTAYQQRFKTTLEQDIRSDTSGDFERLMISMCAGCRDETPANPQLAGTLAQALYTAGEKKTGTDEAEFNRILSSYSYPMLRMVFEEYHKQRGKTFDKVIKSELSGDLETGMLAIFQVISNQPAFFAMQLNDAMKGMGTNDDSLIRLVVSRAEIDMGNIKEEYLKMYNKRLEDAIKSETSGDYKNILIALVEQ